MDSSQVTSPAVLPVPLTQLIGRDREIGDVADLIRRDDVRLVTLTGPGGVGKTRLAIAVASLAADEFPDGVHFVDLSALNDPSLVAPAIAQELGVLHGSHSVGALVAALAQRPRMLLVLDNFEQVVNAASEIVRLLKGVTALKMLVTSREPLRIDGERDYPVSPLALASASDSLDPAHLGQLDSIRLFTGRAQAVLPSFGLTPANAATISAICTRLDGLPLAIELAAARVKALPLEAILTRLDHPLPLLVGDRRDAPKRQQTMRNAIAWSYSLLTDLEQSVFRCLGVFVDGFTLEAAEAVLSGGIPTDDLLPALVSLVDKSLVRLDVLALGGPRYVMLETIREFASERLLASEDHAAIRDAHAAWCIRLAEQRRLHGDVWNEPGGSTATPPAVIEFGNIRAALEWLNESDNLPELARLAGSVYWYWHMVGPRAEGVRWHRLAVTARATTRRDKESLMWALEGHSWLTRNAGQFDEASCAAQDSLVLATELGDSSGQSTALAILSFIAVGQGDYQQAEDFGRQSLETRLQSPAGWPVASALVALGEAALGRHELPLARSRLIDAIEAIRAAEDSWDMAYVDAILALLSCEERAFAEAAERLTDALSIWRDLRTQETISEWLATVAVLALAMGQPDASARMLAAATSLRDTIGHAFVLPARDFFERTECSLRHTLGEEELARVAKAVSAQSLDDLLDEGATFLTRVQTESEAPPAKSMDLPFGLTPREMDVLHLLVSGKSDREIADDLFIGARTVQTHVSNLLAKLNVANRIEAASFAVRQGIV